MYGIWSKPPLFLEFCETKKRKHSRSYVSFFLVMQKIKRTRLGPKDHA